MAREVQLNPLEPRIVQHRRRWLLSLQRKHKTNTDSHQDSD
jgi:hypothetical protein